MKPWIQTFTGKAIDVCDPKPEDIEIEDIAIGLSRQCRFNGQCSRFYSVAEHSVHVSRTLESWGLDRETCFLGLMHDAAEAYVGDIVQPIKRGLANFDAIEERFFHAIADRFMMRRSIPPVVKEADIACLVEEQAELMSPSPRPWRLPSVRKATPLAMHESQWHAAFDLFRSSYFGLAGDERIAEL